MALLLQMPVWQTGYFRDTADRNLFLPKNGYVEDCLELRLLVSRSLGISLKDFTIVFCLFPYLASQVV